MLQLNCFEGALSKVIWHSLSAANPRVKYSIYELGCINMRDIVALCPVGGGQRILTRRADLAEPPDVSSKWPPTRNAHRPHSSATRPEWASPPAGDAVSCVSVAVVVAPSTQSRCPECPAMGMRMGHCEWSMYPVACCRPVAGWCLFRCTGCQS